MDEVVVIERAQSVFGDELQLQQRGEAFEIISNGVFFNVDRKRKIGAGNGS